MEKERCEWRRASSRPNFWDISLGAELFFLYELIDGDEYRALLKDLYYIYAGNSESDPVFGQTLKMTKRFGQHLKASSAFYDFLYGKNIGEIRAMDILGKLSPQQKRKYFEVKRLYEEILHGEEFLDV